MADQCADLEITPTMIEAGERSFRQFWSAGGPDEVPSQEFVIDLFRAMTSARHSLPVE